MTILEFLDADNNDEPDEAQFEEADSASEGKFNHFDFKIITFCQTDI